MHALGLPLLEGRRVTRPRVRVRAARELILEERRVQEGELCEFATRLILRMFGEGRLVYRDRVYVFVWDVRDVAGAANFVFREEVEWGPRELRRLSCLRGRNKAQGIPVSGLTGVA